MNRTGESLEDVEKSAPFTSPSRYAKPRIQPSECRVCGAPAKYSYFGVIVCQPCKMFFKRNGDAPRTNFVCRRQGHCEIDVHNRHACNACRLKKCFQCGMSTERFRAPIQMKKRKTVLTTKILTRDLLQRDRSTLTASQWTLLSNLLLSYHENNTIAIGHRLAETRHAENAASIFPSELIHQFVESMYEAAGEFVRLNADLNQLRSDDRSIAVRNAADRLSSIGGGLCMGYCNLFSYESFPITFIRIYGESTVAKTMWTLKFFNPDFTLMKLGLALLAVSENIVSHPTESFTDLQDPLAILHIQNRYAEATWKYLLYRYGDRDAVKQFLSLTCYLIAATALTIHLQDVARHISNVDSLVEQTEVTLLLNDADEIMKI